MTRYQIAAVGRRTHCSICGRSLSFHQQWAGDICDDWRCRWTRLDREIEAHRQAAARALGEKQPEAYLTLVVPHRPGSIEKLPARRRVDHLKFLNHLVMKVTQGKVCSEEHYTDSRHTDISPPDPLAEAVCAVCAGACCHRAGDQAFLDTAAIARFMAVNGDMEPSNIASSYAAHLPERSFTGSCVYHTFDGCALPRSLRADICNAYRCSGLKQAERWACNDGTTHIYVAVREDNIIRRGAFVQPGNIRHYPPTDALPDSKRPADMIRMRQ
jgi:hypothetical protein